MLMGIEGEMNFDLDELDWYLQTYFQDKFALGVTINVQFLFDWTAACCWAVTVRSDSMPKVTFQRPPVPASTNAKIPKGMYSCYHEMGLMNKAAASSVSQACQGRLRWGFWEANSL